MRDAMKKKLEAAVETEKKASGKFSIN